ncbi:hypothetical protein SLEP1_g55515 [Rubroshorea leprosula]|uniref:Peptidase metallopeptidase domain-containing protein n=1 Tax=Rubroshorea leprosula TaxID=152421 RepID=A0AAV5MFK0_9ROSI|nr:hypothetical protein SLEP1_g55515 [Rubroshorea leprosula]
MSRKLFFLLGAFLLVLLHPFEVSPITLKLNESQFSQLLHSLEAEGCQACHNGTNIEGLGQVKQYLNKYGYYPEGVELTDEFNDQMETALKKYQEYSHLKVTGTLDSSTVKEMMIPRCGFPDIIYKNGTFGKNGNESTSHLVAHYAFAPTRWSVYKTHIVYTFSSSVQAVDMRTLRAAFSQAFQRWAEVSHFTFEEARVVMIPDIVIGFHRLDHGDGYPFDGPGNTICHAFPPEDGRFHFDADESWSTSPAESEYDLESAAMHGIGHLLGLAHSQDLNAVMYRTLYPGTIKRDLTQDDIDGIRALYSNHQNTVTYVCNILGWF